MKHLARRSVLFLKMIMNKKSALLTLSAVALGTVAYNFLKPIRSRVEVVDDFDVNRYLGRWHEIARLDFFWEKGLKNVTAEYQKNADGSIRVKNSGTQIRSGREKISIGKAKLIDDANRGGLKVSFFGPFYSGYHIVQLDADYQHALIFGDNLDYLWILSRTPQLPADVKKHYLAFAEQHGYEVNNLVWTVQDESAG